MSDFNEFMHYRVLAFKYSLRNDELSDKIINEAGDQIPLRNVCAKLSVELVDRLDNALGVLSMSKRQFIEMAIIEALDEVDKVLQEVDAFEYVESRQEADHE